MRNKLTIEFDSIDLNSARTFYNIIREKARELGNKCIYEIHLQTRLDCNLH